MRRKRNRPVTRPVTFAIKPRSEVQVTKMAMILAYQKLSRSEQQDLRAMARDLIEIMWASGVR